MEAGGVLRRIHEGQDTIGVEMPRQWQLHDVARHRPVGVQPMDLGGQLVLRGVGRQIDPDRHDPDLCAVPVLARDVRMAARVIPDEDGAQARQQPAGPKAVDPGA